MEQRHPVIDSDNHFIINPDSRRITTTATDLILIQGDFDSERITFEIPEFVEGHPMIETDRIEVHFINIDRKTKEESKDVYFVKDAHLEGDKVIFSWLISSRATKYSGVLYFLIAFNCYDGSGNYIYSWNTEICKLLKVGSGLNNKPEIIENYPDALAQLQQSITENTSNIDNLNNQIFNSQKQINSLKDWQLTASETISSNTQLAHNAQSNAQVAITKAEEASSKAEEASLKAEEASSKAEEATTIANTAINNIASMRMRLIKKITVEEAVNSVVINTDENENSISLDKFCLILTLPSSVSVPAGGMNILCNDTTPSHYAYYHSDIQNVKHARFEGECMGDTTGAEGAVRHWTINYALGSANSYGNTLKTERYMTAVPTINKMTFKMSPIPVGTVLTLYGRTAI